MTSTTSKTKMNTTHGATSTGKRTPKEAAEPLSGVLRTMKVAEGLSALHDLDERYGVIPASGAAALAQAAAEILTAAARIGVTSIAALVQQQGPLLKALTGVDKPTAIHKTAVADPLHRYRNVIVAIAAASAQSVGASLTPIWSQSLRLRARTCQLGRPLFDDEILLARVHAAIGSDGNPKSQRACIYAMLDAGLVPGETTPVSLNDFDDIDQPTELLAPGNGHLDPRLLPLDRFAQAVLGRRTRAANKSNMRKPLTYAPRKNAPGSAAASASAHGVVDRILTELGLADIDVTASSVMLWRLATVYATAGADTATAMSGRRSRAQMEAILFRAPVSANVLTQPPAITGFLAA
jgi:hypothetical protein